jgi:hypothetical protein
MTVSPVLDAAGRRRSPATIPGYHAGRPPRNKGQLYPADPPTVEEIIAVMRKTGDDRHGFRLRADRRAVAWRAAHSGSARARRTRPRPSARIAARAQRQGRPAPRDRHGRLGLGAAATVARRPRRAADRAVVLRHRRADPRRPWSSANVRVEFRRLAAHAGIRRRFAPHQLRHAHAIELAREGVPLNVIQRQLGHANLGTTSIYLQAIDTEEIIAMVHARRAPMMSASAGLRV